MPHFNGEVWIPYFKCSLSGDPCGEISARYGSPYAAPDQISFQVGRNLSNQRSSLTITSIAPITTIGDKFTSINVSYLTGNGTNLATVYSKTDQSIGNFIITKIDLLNQIISGAFEFKLYNSSGGTDSVEITEGRFDFKMNVCICRY